MSQWMTLSCLGNLRKYEIIISSVPKTNIFNRQMLFKALL